MCVIKTTDYEPSFSFTGDVLTADAVEINPYRMTPIKLVDENNWAHSFTLELAPQKSNCKLSIKEVIFNEPATIILWKNGDKTVVKTQNGERYDKEKGFVLACLKYLLGNDNTFNKEIHKWVTED